MRRRSGLVLLLTHTLNGVALTSFQSNMPGIVTVMAQAGSASDSNDITVTGTGSTIYQDEQRPGR